MTIDYSISLGNIMTIGSFVVMAILYMTTVKSDTRILAIRLENVDTEIEDFKEELKKLTQVVIDQNRLNDRLNLVDQRMLAEGKRIDVLDSRFHLYVEEHQYQTRHQELKDRVAKLEDEARGR